MLRKVVQYLSEAHGLAPEGGTFPPPLKGCVELALHLFKAEVFDMSDSSWKKSAADRRDARNTKSPEASKPVPSKKDTKRWCKGKVGVEHKLECRDYVATKNAPEYLNRWKLLICTACGKELERWAPFGRRANNPPPEWVK